MIIELMKLWWEIQKGFASCWTLSDSLNPAVQDNFLQQVIALIFLHYFSSMEEIAKV